MSVQEVTVVVGRRDGHPIGEQTAFLAVGYHRELPGDSERGAADWSERIRRGDQPTMAGGHHFADVVLAQVD